jgi:hypothetical protein
MGLIPHQVFAAAKVLGTEPGKIEMATAEGGHIGLFMGSKPLKENWSKIAALIPTLTARGCLPFAQVLKVGDEEKAQCGRSPERNGPVTHHHYHDRSRGNAEAVV